MSVIQRVLFPIDLSFNHRTLNATTRGMFDRKNIEIVLLNAIEETSRSPRGTEVARSQAQLEFFARQEFAAAKVVCCAERGKAAECILEFARNHAVDVVVMSAGGHDSVAHTSLGRVTEAVLSDAPCAVWIEWMTGSPESPRHICCAVQFDESDEAVLRRADQVAAEFGADLTVIHAVAPEPPMALWWDPDTFQQEVRMARLRVEELCEGIAPAARIHVEVGRLDAVISRVLHRLEADLLVSAGQGEAIAAAAMACPVLRLAGKLPEVARTVQPRRDGALAATA
jgi:nucleotide-binding universal stress UspA family protein